MVTLGDILETHWGDILGDPWGHVGTRWGHGDPPGDVWGLFLGGFGDGFGPILGTFGVTLGDILETHWGDTPVDSCRYVGDMWGHVGATGTHLEMSGDSSWGGLGVVLVSFWGHLGLLLGTFWRDFGG